MLPTTKFRMDAAGSVERTTSVQRKSCAPSTKRLYLRIQEEDTVPTGLNAKPFQKNKWSRHFFFSRPFTGNSLSDYGQALQVFPQLVPAKIA